MTDIYDEKTLPYSSGPNPETLQMVREYRVNFSREAIMANPLEKELAKAISDISEPVNPETLAIVRDALVA